MRRESIRRWYWQDFGIDRYLRSMEGKAPSLLNTINATDTVPWDECAKDFFLGAVIHGVNFAAEPHWRNSHDSTEYLCEMTLVGESDRSSRPGQGDLRIAQVLLCAFNSAPQDVLVRGQTCTYLEKLAEVVRTHAGYLGELPEAKIPCQVLVNKLQSPVQACRRHAAGVSGPTAITDRIPANQIGAEC